MTGLGGGDAVATLVTVAGGRVVSLQQVSTEQPDPHAEAAVAAIRSGDVTALTAVLNQAPHLTRVPVPGYRDRTLCCTSQRTGPAISPTAPALSGY